MVKKLYLESCYFQVLSEYHITIFSSNNEFKNNYDFLAKSPFLRIFQSLKSVALLKGCDYYENMMDNTILAEIWVDITICWRQGSTVEIIPRSFHGSLNELGFQWKSIHPG